MGKAKDPQEESLLNFATIRRRQNELRLLTRGVSTSDTALDSVTRREWMKSHVLLLSRVLEDTGIRCCTSTTRDLNTITRRVEDEGLSFLTITLPTFGKDFERSLDLGRIDSFLFKAFAKKGKWLPAFLQGYTSQVFDEYTGALVDEPSIDAIQAIRQISYLFKRFEAECTEERQKAAFEGFINCDITVDKWDAVRPTSKLVEFATAARTVLGPVLHEVNNEVYHMELIPHHGPGATADRLKANAKYDNRLWSERLESIGFYSNEWLYPSVSHALEDETGVHYEEPGAETPVRVVSVPKTMKTPRIIAIEPTYKQYVQQALKDRITWHIGGSDSLRHVIGFKDQERNHILACQGSSTGDLATLDLSEASDRVSNQLVRAMFSQTPHLHDAVEACRSPRADVPGHGIHSLAKFASMGSALTFPVEAMVFTTIVFMGMAKALRAPLTPGFVKRHGRSVRVYGDDIIVPVTTVHAVINELQSFGLVVNKDKSFWTGKFRESCGKDFYDGHDVSVVKVKTEIPTSRRQAREIVSTVALRNHMYFSGYWRTAEYLDRQLEKVIPFPVVGPDSPGLGRHSHLGYEVQRECPYLQRPLVKAAVEYSRPPHSQVSGTGALLKFFLSRVQERDMQGLPPFDQGPVTAKDHLVRAGRPEVVNIKLRWVPAY